ncbi:MAG: FGGY-family carbohydrate kinase [Actinomycetota bacterium]|jgi:glycerol kinase|nr:FGGY-family carbohydrate kinase [Actinomycetota bacterium]
MSILVVDVGTSGVRAAVVRPDGSLDHVHQRPVLPTTPFPGLVEVDGAAIAAAVLELATAALARAGAVEGIGITNQRATTLVWDRATGVPVAPGIGWQDLRTVGTCLALQERGLRLGPNASATKLAAVLDAVDPDRSRSRSGALAFGTVDTFVAWVLSDGAVHVTDATNAAVTGLVDRDGRGWDPDVLDALAVPEAVLPTIVDSSGVAGLASALTGAPPIAGIVGDQQGSLVGQGCTLPGRAKATFGTGAMLDQCVGTTRPPFTARGDAGTIPIVAWRRTGVTTWGVEAIALSAGSCVEWLRDDLGIIDDAAHSAAVAAGCTDTGDVWFVPALLGLGTPVWDFGARGTFLGITRGTGRPELVRAVLEGVAHRGADLREAAMTDTGLPVDVLRVDGGMAANQVFVAALADACGVPVEVAPVVEATTLGAGFLAGIAVGTWSDEEETAGLWAPAATVDPRLDEAARLERRARWGEARSRAERTIPELSALDF